MSVRVACALVSVSLVVSGCSLYRVRSGRDERRLDGVPFFPRVGVCRQETAYVEPVYRVAVQAIVDGHDVPLFETVLVSAAITSPEMRALRRALKSPDTGAERIEEAFDALAKPAHRYDPLATPAGLYLASNTVVVESQADYGDPLYLNVSRPWIGSASADTRLAPDGTLTQASAEVKEATLDTLLSAVPARELLTALAPADRVQALVGRNAAGTATLLQLAIEPRYVKHIYTVLAAAPCARTAPPIPPGLPGAMYRREQLSTAEPGRKP